MQSFCLSHQSCFSLYWRRGFSFSEENHVEMALKLLSLAQFFASLKAWAICLNVVCAHPLQSSLEETQRKWLWGPLWAWTVFHRHRSCPQLHLTNFQTSNLKKTEVWLPLSRCISLGLGLVPHATPVHTGRAETRFYLSTPSPFPLPICPQVSGIPMGFVLALWLAFAQMPGSAGSVSCWGQETQKTSHMFAWMEAERKTNIMLVVTHCSCLGNPDFCMRITTCCVLYQDLALMFQCLITARTPCLLVLCPQSTPTSYCLIDGQVLAVIRMDI